MRKNTTIKYRGTPLVSFCTGHAFPGKRRLSSTSTSTSSSSSSLSRSFDISSFCHSFEATGVLLPFTLLSSRLIVDADRVFSPQPCTDPRLLWIGGETTTLSTKLRILRPPSTLFLFFLHTTYYQPSLHLTIPTSTSTRSNSDDLSGRMISHLLLLLKYDIFEVPPFETP